MADLTLKQRKFIKYYLSSGNASQSALKAGYATRTSAFENLSNPIIKAYLKEYMDKQGITDRKLIKVIGDGLEANKVIGYLHQYKNKNGKIEKIKPDEVVSNEFIETPDHQIRHKFLETALKLKELLAEKVEHSGEIKTGGDKIIIIRPQVKKEELIEDRIKEVSR